MSKRKKKKRSNNGWLVKHQKKINKRNFEKISLENLENHYFNSIRNDFPIYNQGNYPLSKRIKKFFKEFEKNSSMKLTNEYGGFRYYRNDGGLVILSDWRNKLNDYSHPLSGSTIVLEWIVSNVDSRKKGWGNKMMTIITSLSKKYDISIRLHCSDCSDWKKNNVMKKYISNGMSTKELKKWYMKYGFELDPTTSLYYLKSKNKTMKDVLINVSSSIKESMRFPSLLGYNGYYNWDSTVRCYDIILTSGI